MKASELRDKTIDELDDQVASLKKEQFNMRFMRASGQLDNVARIRQVRRDIARVMTVATQKRKGAKA
jgi:large subunit ribosomal protein L29